MTKALFLASLFLLASILLHAQIQFNAIGSYLKGSGYYDNHAALLGGGMSMKYMIAEQYFIGGVVRTYKASTTAYQDFNAQDRGANFSGTVDVVFRKRKPVQPYLGIGAGVSTVTHMIRYVRTFHDFVTYSARGGVQINIGKSTGFFTQLEYNYTPGDGAPVPWDAIANPVVTEPISKYICFDFGLYIRLYYMRENKKQ